MAVFTKAEHTIPDDSATLYLAWYPTETCMIYINVRAKDMNKNIRNSIFHNSQKMEITQMPINSRINK